MATHPNEVQLYTPSWGENTNQYGRDFFHEDAGFARIELVPGFMPRAVVEFFHQPEWEGAFIGARSRVDLVDAITDDPVVQGLVFTAIQTNLKSRQK